MSAGAEDSESRDAERPTVTMAIEPTQPASADSGTADDPRSTSTTTS